MTRGGHPPFDAVLKFRMLVRRALHRLSLEQTTHLVRSGCAQAAIKAGKSAKEI